MNRKLSRSVALALDTATIAVISLSRAERAKFFRALTMELQSQCRNDDEKCIIDARVAEAKLRASLFDSERFEEFTAIVGEIRQLTCFELGRKDEILEVAYAAGKRLWPNEIEKIFSTEL